MNKIDWNLPIEDSNGRACVLQGRDGDTPGRPYVVAYETDGHSANHFNVNGYRPGKGSRWVPSGQLRNRIPSFKAGDKVFFRNGTEGVVVGTAANHVYAARLSEGSQWGRGIVGVRTRLNGRISAHPACESPDDISLTPWPAPVTHTFRNVYSDGTTGATAHKTLDTAKLAAKVGKTRIGILKVGSDGETELLRCKPSVRASGYTAATFEPLL